MWKTIQRAIAISICTVLAAGWACAGRNNEEERANRQDFYERCYERVGRNKKNCDKGLARINAYRRSARIAAMQLDLKFSLAAQAHADYLAGNKIGLTHEQRADFAGYIGKEFNQRLAFFKGKRPAFECISTNTDPEQAVDGLIASVYHRIPFLDPDNDRVGFGMAQKVTVIDFGRASKPRGRNPVIYPMDKQKDVPVSWKVNEMPNPVQQFGSPAEVGYPISVRFPYDIEFVSAKLSVEKEEDEAAKPEAPRTGIVPVAKGPEYVDVEALVLHEGNDKTKFLKRHVFIMTKKPMKPDTTYCVEVVVKVKKADKTVRWSFTTAAEAPPEKPGARARRR